MIDPAFSDWCSRRKEVVMNSHNILRATLVFASLLTLARISSVAPAQAQAGFTVSNIKRGNLLDGCGCDLKLSGKTQSPGSVFVARIGEGPDNRANQAWIDIDGRDIELTYVYTIKKPGNRRTEYYSAAGIIVRVAWSWLRKAGGESSTYSATITVSKNNHSRKLQAAGDCGC